MKKISMILVLCAVLPVAVAQRITYEFRNVSMSDALKELQSRTGYYNIVFIYNELEDFRVTAEIRNKSVPETIRQLIGFYPIRMTVDADGGIYVECIQKAAHRLTGRLVDEYGKPLAYANVALLAPSDSAFLSGGVSNETGHFTIPCDQPEFIVRISYVGYKTLERLCVPEDMGLIGMEPESKVLGEVVVKGYRPIVTVKNSVLTAHVANTELANLGNAHDVLSRLPLLNVIDDKLEVFGKGKPLVLIDNRQMRDASELQMLQSGNIKSVQIITMPGAEYGSAVRAVIKIQTKQRFMKGLSGTVTANGEAKRVWQRYVKATLGYSWNDWQIFGDTYFYGGGTRNYRRNGSTFDWAGRTDNSIMHTAVEKRSFATKSVRGGFNYNKNNQSFGAYYHYVDSPITFDSEGLQDTHVAGEADQHIGDRIYNKSWTERHTVAAYYDNQLDGESLVHFDGNYVYRWLKADNMTSNQFPSHSIIVPSQNGMKSTLWAGKLYYEFPLLIGKMNIGTEDSYTYNHQQYVVMNDEISHHIPSTQNESKQYVFAAYATFSKNIGSLALNAGLRWENVKFDYWLNNRHDVDVSRNQSSLSPDVSLSWQIGQRTSMSLDYKQYIVRPAYQQLRSQLLYVGPYEVEGGNPTLADCYNYSLSYMFNWRNLIFDAEYTYKKDAYVYTKEHYKRDTPQLIFTSHNEDYSILRAYLTYSPTFGIWKPNATVGINKQFLTMYGDGYSHPIWEYSFKNMLLPDKNWIITCDMTGTTRGHEMANDFSGRWGIDFAVRRYFLGKRLQVMLSANDIFHTRNDEWVIWARDVSTFKYSDNDSRKFLFSVTYQFNPKKNKYRGAGAADAEKSRL